MKRYKLNWSFDFEKKLVHEIIYKGDIATWNLESWRGVWESQPFIYGDEELKIAKVLPTIANEISNNLKQYLYTSIMKAYWRFQTWMSKEVISLPVKGLKYKWEDIRTIKVNTVSYENVDFEENWEFLCISNIPYVDWPTLHDEEKLYINTADKSNPFSVKFSKEFREEWSISHKNTQKWWVQWEFNESLMNYTHHELIFVEN